MSEGFASLVRAWQGARRFRKLPPNQRAIVFYAEDNASWVHFEAMIDHLTGPLQRKVAYLTSSATDPRLDADLPNFRAFYIGRGAVRTSLFVAIEADVMVMTMPDIGVYHLARSKGAPVHYVYVFHSLVSTHMIYRPGAFDHYDTILCAGPHHEREVRAQERIEGLAPKRLVEHGYGRLDALLAEAARRAAAPPSRSTRLRVLVAPSWGPTCLIESMGVELTRTLLGAGFQVTVRPHPRTAQHAPESIEALERAFGDDDAFELDRDMGSQESLHASDVMVSDWSGAALEYALGLERPVVFVDVARKVNNPAYEKIPEVPLEVSIRSEIGEIVAPDRLADLPAAIERLCGDEERFRDHLSEVRSRVVYNVGSSGPVGAESIASIADEAPDRRR